MRASGQHAAPADAGGHEPIAEAHLREELAVEPAEEPRDELLQVRARHARLHHLDQEPLHVRLALGERDVAHEA
jgi:hypothetical protein